MPSDEALRVALVCTLPLLHFSPSLVAVVRTRSTGPEGKGCRDVTLAVPPPRFDAPVPLTRPTASGPSYPPRLSQLPRLFSSRCRGSPRLDFQRVLGDSVVRSQPLRSIPRTLVHRTAAPELRSLRHQRRLLARRPSHTLKHPRTTPISAFDRVISYAVRLLTLAALSRAVGPVRQGGRTHCLGLGSKATLCSFFTNLTEVVGA